MFSSIHIRRLKALFLLRQEFTDVWRARQALCSQSTCLVEASATLRGKHFWQLIRRPSSADQGSFRKDCTSNIGFGKSVWGIFCTLRLLDQPWVAEWLMLVPEMCKFDVASGDISKAEILLDQLLVAGLGSWGALELGSPRLWHLGIAVPGHSVSTEQYVSRNSWRVWRYARRAERNIRHSSCTCLGCYCKRRGPRSFDKKLA